MGLENANRSRGPATRTGNAWFLDGPRDIAEAWRRTPNTSAVSAAGVIDASTLAQDFYATRETPAVRARDPQRATREGQAGPFGVAERLVVPLKPGNSGGGKEPQLEGNA